MKDTQVVVYIKIRIEEKHCEQLIKGKRQIKQRIIPKRFQTHREDGDRHSGLKRGKEQKETIVKRKQI